MRDNLIIDFYALCEDDKIFILSIVFTFKWCGLLCDRCNNKKKSRLIGRYAI